MRPKYAGVKFYSEEDLSCGYNLEKAENVLSTIDINDRKQYHINEILELYNIYKFCNADVRLKRWDDRAYSLFKEHTKKIFLIIGTFFSNQVGKSILDFYANVAFIYIADYWEMLCVFNVYKKIERIDFERFLQQNASALPLILHNEKVVKFFGAEIACYMRQHTESAECLMNEFLSHHDAHWQKYYFPSELALTDKENILTSYLDSPDANPNYFTLLQNGSKDPSNLSISDKLRLKAKHKQQDFCRKFFADGKGQKYTVKIEYSKNIQFEAESKYKPDGVSLKYSVDWISENLDYPTVLNNFITLFEYVDFCYRATFVSVKAHISTMEALLGIKGEDSYFAGYAFQLLEMISSMQMRAYRNQLQQNGIQLEDVLHYFFAEYLPETFDVNGFVFDVPSQETTWKEKCVLLSSAMDGVLKQFTIYVQNGEIDRELFEMNSKPEAIGSIPSFFPLKYAYANGRDIENQMALLFSDQSPLSYTTKTEEKYNSFAEMMATEKMLISDFEEWQMDRIKYLIEQKILEVNNAEILHMDQRKALLLKDLYDHDVICPYYYSEKDKEQIERWIHSGKLKAGGTLFSLPEQEYLDYKLNKKTYINGQDLRNRYIHATYPKDEKIQQSDYIELLKIMVLIIIKIYEEFDRHDIMIHNESQQRP
ncbi:MAG: hypothetical protein LKJ90_04145 [Faecalibacterium sp.]|jgi:hypothetical protein|nr:hypothetical protein [Faecalibacterium sp.]